jgi:hypothetical protein
MQFCLPDALETPKTNAKHENSVYRVALGCIGVELGFDDESCFS